MTVAVNAETGEILDVEKAERRASYIRTDLDFAAGSFEKAMERMREAISERDDIALGYRSPGDYLVDRFGGHLARLGVDLRREVVRELTEAGFSSRAIAPVVGVSDRMVRKDQNAGGNSVPTPETPAPELVGEADEGAGQITHAPEDEESPSPEVVATDDDDVEPVVPEPSTPAAPRPPVVGIDGKTYSRPAPSPKPVLDDNAAEYDNAAKASLALTRAISKLLEFQHSNMRDGMKKYWSMASIEVPPVQRADVTPEQMRAAAHGLLTLADEWD